MFSVFLIEMTPFNHFKMIESSLLRSSKYAPHFILYFLHCIILPNERFAFYGYIMSHNLLNNATHHVNASDESLYAKRHTPYGNTKAWENHVCCCSSLTSASSPFTTLPLGLNLVPGWSIWIVTN